MRKKRKTCKMLAIVWAFTLAILCLGMYETRVSAADIEIFTDGVKEESSEEKIMDDNKGGQKENEDLLESRDIDFYIEEFSDQSELPDSCGEIEPQADEKKQDMAEVDIFENTIEEEEKDKEDIFGDATEPEEMEGTDLQLTANTGFSSAVQIGVNSNYKDCSESKSDINLYKFTIAKAGYVSLSFGKEYDSNTSRRWYAALYNSSQTEIMSRTFYCGKTTTETTCKIGVPAGTYYLKITPDYYNWSNVLYNFKINYIPHNTWETEFNDTVETADNLSVGTTYYGSSREKKDIDYYKINIAKTGHLSLSFGKEYDSNKNRRWNVTLYDSSQSEIIVRTFYCGTSAIETTCKVGVPAGTYYIKVCPEYYNWSDITYSLKVNYTSSNEWETEFNDTVGTADRIAYGKTFYGSSREKKDIDYYKIDIAKVGYLSLSFGKEYDSNAYHRWYVTLYNESQKEMLGRTFYCGTTTTETTCKIGIPAGTYYIKVCPEYYNWSDVTYNLRVNYYPNNAWETEFNDMVGEADSLALNKTYYGSSRERKDIDYYKVSTNSSGYLSISFGKEYDSSSGRRWYVELFDSSQRKIKGYTFYCGNTNTEITERIWTSSGIYYIKVTPEYYNWSDVTYKIKINLNLPTPSISSVSNKSSGINVKWGKVSNATGYYIYRKTGSNGKWTKIKTVSGGTKISYTDTAVKNKNSTTYYYKVYAFNSKIKSTGSGSKRIVRMIAPTLSTPQNTSSRKITVKWKKNSKASGYQIQYATSKKFSGGNKTKTITGKSTVSTVISGLIKGKTYYVRIRSYRTVNGIKYYSSWSSVKSTKILK